VYDHTNTYGSYYRQNQNFPGAIEADLMLLKIFEDVLSNFGELKQLEEYSKVPKRGLFI